MEAAKSACTQIKPQTAEGLSLFALFFSGFKLGSNDDTQYHITRG
jgi:hypothetical protein